MNKSESRYFNTAKKMDKALISLLGEKSFEYITISEICKKAKLPATIFTYTFGIISSLIVGTGMSLAMQAIGSGTVAIIAGIIIGIIGFILCGINYPIYKRMLERDKAKYAYEIVELAREISEEK